MPQTVYPTVSKTITQTELIFNFIERDEHGNLTETQPETRLIDQRKSKNVLQVELQKEFPDLIVNVISVKSQKTRYSMTADEFMKLAKSEKVEDEPK